MFFLPKFFHSKQSMISGNFHWASLKKTVKISILYWWIRVEKSWNEYKSFKFQTKFKPRGTRRVFINHSSPKSTMFCHFHSKEGSHGIQFFTIRAERSDIVPSTIVRQRVAPSGRLNNVWLEPMRSGWWRRAAAFGMAARTSCTMHFAICPMRWCWDASPTTIATTMADNRHCAIPCSMRIRPYFEPFLGCFTFILPPPRRSFH